MSTVLTRNNVIISALVFIIISNILLYNSDFYYLLEVQDNKQVVIGSLIDLLLVAPILVFLLLKKRDFKRLVAIAAFACIIATISIPKDLLAPYKTITTTGIIFELVIVSVELFVIGLFLLYIPKLKKAVRASKEPSIFAYNLAVSAYSGNKIIHILASELLIVYYALFSWRKKAPSGITLHKNSSYIAMQVMIIHALILESLGLHWWLHGVAPVISIILLILNGYGLLFLLADLQVMRLQPIQADENGIYITFGLMKRAYITYSNIDEIIEEPAFLTLKKQKDRVEFVCKDFEEVHPQIVLKMKELQIVSFLYGFKKRYKYVAIKCDDISRLKSLINENKVN